MKKAVISLSIVLVILIGAVTSLTLAEKKVTPEYAKDSFSQADMNFQKAKELLMQKYVNKGFSDEDFYKAALSGVLQSLNQEGETWNKLMAPYELSEMEDYLNNQIVGIGVAISIDSKTGIPSVDRVIPGTPSEKQDIKEGDMILSVNGKHCRGKELRDIVYEIRGKAGEKVSLKLLRGDEIIAKTIVREQVKWDTVTTSWLPNKVGLILINAFVKTTPALLKKQIEQMKAQGLNSLIIDLRGNSGGDLDKVIESAELFIPKGETIVKLQDRKQQMEEIKSKLDPLVKNIPIIIIVNKETASGGELFAATLSEQLGVKLVGEKTRGKWSVEDIEKLPNGFAIKFTIKMFYTPSGKNYLNKGITPDIEVAVANAWGYEGFNLIRDMNQRLEKDTQLRSALEIIKAIK